MRKNYKFNNQPINGPGEKAPSVVVIFFGGRTVPGGLLNFSTHRISNSSREGKAGKAPCGSLWYQKATEAISSCRGR